MTTATKNITAAAVSRTLGKTTNRSKSARSMVRGYPTISAGFKVSEPSGNSNLYGTVVWVEYNSGSGVHRQDWAETQASRLAHYARILEAAGYTVKMPEDPTVYRALLSVTR